MHSIYDCLIVGGGPAGLVAAVYLARFRRHTVLVDARSSRASLIPMSHNLAGFPDGISGRDLLKRQRAHALRYGAEMLIGAVTRLEEMADGGIFAAAVLRSVGKRGVQRVKR